MSYSHTLHFIALQRWLDQPSVQEFTKYLLLESALARSWL